jgi:prepilin signal peptidase PulO-like enzyme (type II secretory pathway)
VFDWSVFDWMLPSDRMFKIMAFSLDMAELLFLFVGASLGAGLAALVECRAKNGRLWPSAAKPAPAEAAPRFAAWRWTLLAAASGAAIAVSADQVAVRPWHLALLLAAGWLLLFASLIDARAQLLPRPLNLAFAALGIAEALLLPGRAHGETAAATAADMLAPLLMPANLQARLIGAVIAFAALMLVRTLYTKLRQRDGLGLGDAFLFGALGLWLGWQALPWLMCCTALPALIGVLSWSALTGKLFANAASQRFAFGPWLAISGWAIIIAQRL